MHGLKLMPTAQRLGTRSDVMSLRCLAIQVSLDDTHHHGIADFQVLTVWVYAGGTSSQVLHVDSALP